MAILPTLPFPVPPGSPHLSYPPLKPCLASCFGTSLALAVIFEGEIPQFPETLPVVRPFWHHFGRCCGPPRETVGQEVSLTCQFATFRPEAAHLKLQSLFRIAPSRLRHNMPPALCSGFPAMGLRFTPHAQVERANQWEHRASPYMVKLDC